MLFCFLFGRTWDSVHFIASLPLLACFPFLTLHILFYYFLPLSFLLFYISFLFYFDLNFFSFLFFSLNYYFDQSHLSIFKPLQNVQIRFLQLLRGLDTTNIQMCTRKYEIYDSKLPFPNRRNKRMRQISLVNFSIVTIYFRECSLCMFFFLFQLDRVELSLERREI